MKTPTQLKLAASMLRLCDLGKTLAVSDNEEYRKISTELLKIFDDLMDVLGRLPDKEITTESFEVLN